LQGYPTISNLFNKVWDTLKSPPGIGKAFEMAEKAVDSVKEGAKNLLDSAKTKVSNGIDAVVDAAGNTMVGRGVKIVSNAVDGLLGRRRKQDFTGIAGGDQLREFGSYTDEEAARVRSLKTAKANTSATLKGGMPPGVQKKIVEQAKEYGLDPTMMLKMAAMESGGNAQAISSTGAIGVYQLTGKTATSVGIENRFDEDQNIKGGMKLTVQNQAARKKAGLPVTPENLYMAHQLGIGAAIEVIRGAKEGKKISELSASTRKGMDLNYGKGSDTAAQYIEKNKKALEDRYASSIKQGKEPAQASVPAVTATPNAPTLAAPAPPVAANVPTPRVAAAPPAVPAIPTTPSAQAPVASDRQNRQNVVATERQQVNQDLRDRRIAHVVTGGLSA
jgi:hypothetical protein